MLVQTWCMNSAHQNSSYQCMLANSFGGTVSTFAQPQTCRCLSIKTLNSLVHSPAIEHEETLYQLTLVGCQTFVTTPGHVTGSDSPWSYMAMRALIQVEDAYELIFHSICNFCVFLPQIKQLHCIALNVCASQVSILCIFLDFILYTNFANEFIISFQITYKILRVYIEMFSFFLYGLMMAINVTKTCGCWHCCIACCVDG
jgi:hypothetical protein